MNELTKSQMCVMIRGGIEIWIDADQTEKLKKAMESQKYVNLKGSTVAVFDIQGVYTPEHVEEHKRYLNGQFKCMKGNWHDKNQKCDCRQSKGTRKGFVEGIGEIEYPDF